ncbi:hypothetical protein BCR33DRAFT_712937 [Rhizoclosmatium globosum]|uniref:PCI domain-containing protein n=1 Tax=Rhizoclosmatium globosum TaxID=329046 RepID=A0A1Y2CVD2_9FUNG|nr:hypothetical protein BCR33DRAFT_712937 [Rhizoclosmatium globosum]|eukprot:ORY50988.1 hypothetical protein BCR33DRAFT_712937 [Rhizoclosmatium globosum]
MHANYLALFVAFEGYMCEDFHIQVYGPDPDPKITLTNASQNATFRWSSRFSFFIPINASFKICFKLNELTRCPKIIEQVDLVLHVVTFNFYLGRLKLIHHEFNLADKALSLAYNLCPPHYYNQKRHILLYLTVARLVLGAHPSPHLLEEYSLSHIFMPLIQALLSGNLAQYEYIVSSMQPFLMLHKCFGILRYRTRVTLFRNLVKRVWMIQNQPRTLSFHEVCVAARVSGFGSEFSVEDAECLVQSLVDQGFLLGYLNHGKRCVVLRGEVFPTMYSLK